MQQLSRQSIGGFRAVPLLDVVVADTSGLDRWEVVLFCIVHGPCLLEYDEMMAKGTKPKHEHVVCI